MIISCVTYLIFVNCLTSDFKQVSQLAMNSRLIVSVGSNDSLISITVVAGIGSIGHRIIFPN